MRKIILATATALSMAAVPAAAQQADAPLGSTNSVADKRELTAEQQAMYDAMPADQRASFDTWENNQQTLYFGWNDALRGYYWSLSDAQQNAWWYLTPEQRVDMFQLQDETRREMAWNGVLEQVASLDGPRYNEALNTRGTTTGTQVPQTDLSQNRQARATTTQVSYVSHPMVQDAPAPHQGEYPVCMEAGITDNCINAWAAGQRGAGVDRPLDYWPGQSVTESRMDS